MKSLFKILSLFIIVSCRPYTSVYPKPNTLLAIDTSLAGDAKKINKLIQPYKAALESEMGKVIGYSPSFLEKQKPSSALGSYMADAVLAQAKKCDDQVDFCLLNYGGIRSTLDSGEITVGDIFELMPFENEIVILTLSKTMVQNLIEFIKVKNGEPFSKELLNLPEKQFYKMATNDYIANGGDDYMVLQNAVERIECGVKIRDAILNNLNSNFNIEPDNAPRAF
ncbi:MAG: hypothetical protein RLZZ337_1353 [Bacteroidota bacterium]